MDIYILDDQFRRIDVFDRYESFIWTERYSSYGDFELTCYDDFRSRAAFPIGTHILIRESNRVMEVETMESETDTENRQILSIKGRDLSKYLENRAGIPALSSLTTADKWSIEATPKAAAETIFEKALGNDVLNAGDEIPFYNTDRWPASGNLPFVEDSVKFELDFDNAYNQIKKICDMYSMGFSVTRRESDLTTHINIYRGSDRTGSQTTNAPVIFGQDLDTLAGVKELTSNADYFNVAYVVATNGAMMVYDDGVESSVSGFDRKVLFVKADDIDLAAGSALDAAMTQRGKEALAEHRPIVAFDGEIPNVEVYKYGTDYVLGDLVDLRTNSGKINQMLVTEQIFISDGEGDRSYPTLEFDRLITPGSWASWTGNQVWMDVDDYWALV